MYTGMTIIDPLIDAWRCDTAINNRDQLVPTLLKFDPTAAGNVHTMILSSCIMHCYYILLLCCDACTEGMPRCVLSVVRIV
jgi:hypothetical protein